MPSFALSGMPGNDDVLFFSFSSRLVQLPLLKQSSVHYSLQRLLMELIRQYAAEGIGPLFLYINSRVTPVRNADEVSKALTNALGPGKLQRLANYTISSMSWLSSISINAGLITFSLETCLSKLFRMDGKLEPTIKKFVKLLTLLEALPRKPVIVIGTLQTYAEKQTSNAEFSFPPFLDIF